jgi:DMSO/TMAO reductase YedYZ molybdopterin-dependent catalytic subunit
MTDAERPDRRPRNGEREHASEPPVAPLPAADDDPAQPPAPRRRAWTETLVEPPESVIEMPRRRLAAQSRRDFLLLAAGTVAAAAGAWWLLPDIAKARLLPGKARIRLDVLAGRLGLSRASRERVLDRALGFDDDVAAALFSRRRRVRTYRRSDVTRLPVNYSGRVPGPEYLATWTLRVSGLASGRAERLRREDLAGRFPLHQQVTRLVCVEGWSAIAWWGGIRFAEFLAAFPPAPGARWAALRSAVSLDSAGRPDPYYVSLDLETARHPQVLLATHLGGRPLMLPHGAPLRLLAPMKLGLKNIKALTDIAYMASEPPDYWHERGYSRFDGL